MSEQVTKPEPHQAIRALLEGLHPTAGKLHRQQAADLIKWIEESGKTSSVYGSYRHDVIEFTNPKKGNDPIKLIGITDGVTRLVCIDVGSLSSIEVGSMDVVDNPDSHKWLEESRVVLRNILRSCFEAGPDTSTLEAFIAAYLTPDEVCRTYHLLDINSYMTNSSERWRSMYYWK